MADILDRFNRHLFLEDSDNTGNSFIANVNEVVDRKAQLDTVAAGIENINTVSEHIDKVDTVADNIQDISDTVDNINTVKTFNDNVNNGTMQYLLEAFTESLDEEGNAWAARLTRLGESIVASTSAFNYSTVVTVTTPIASGGTLTLPSPMKYKVGTHMLMVSWNGTVCYAGDQYNEVGAYGVWSTTIALNHELREGDKIQFRTVALIDSSAFVDITETALNTAEVLATGSSTSRNLPDRFSDMVNVKDFGAKSDDNYDDTVAFQSAIATGKCVFVPSGTYKLTTNLIGTFCSVDDVTFVGGTVNGSSILRGQGNRNKDIINVKDFGAKGDAKTDDTAAFQAAIDYFASGGTGNAIKCIFIPPGYYKVTGNILIPDTAHSLLFYGAGPRASVIEDVVPYVDGALFRVEIYSVFFQNLQIRNNVDIYSDVERHGVLFQRPKGAEADIDAQFTNCIIRGFSSGIKCIGRGLKVNDCIISLTKRSIELEWPNEGDYTLGDEFVQDDAHGYRGFQFTDSRFHSVRTGVTNTGTNAKKIRGMLMSGCLQDVGRPLFEGVLRNSVIDNCVVDMNTVHALNLTDGSENYIVSNCNFIGRMDAEDPEQIPGSFIQIRGNHKSGTFTGLSLQNCSRHGIDIRDGKFENGVFDNILMDNIALVDENAGTRGNYAGIVFVGNFGHSAIVRGLHVNSNENTQAAISVGYSTSDIQFFDITTSGTIPTYNGSGSHTGQKAVLDGSGDAYLEFIDRAKFVHGKIGNATVGARGLLLEAYGNGPIIISGSLRPFSNNVDIGSTLYPFKNITCQQVFQISDKTFKQDIESLPDELLEIWKSVHPKIYRMKQDVEQLGDAAPQRIGYTAQDIIKAFENTKFDPLSLNLLHVSSQIDGTLVYSVNYDTVHILESALIRNITTKG